MIFSFLTDSYIQVRDAGIYIALFIFFLKYMFVLYKYLEYISVSHCYSAWVKSADETTG